jgi:rare lipoprotein A
MTKKFIAMVLVLVVWAAIFIAVIFALFFTSKVLAAPPPTNPVLASHYGVGDGFHGRRTASGEVFNAYALTAAHKTLRFGTQLRVTNVRTGKSVVVRINDRGPYAHGRGLDLSYAAARAIGLRGVGYVVVEKV